MVGPEALQGLTAVALEPAAARDLFGIVNVTTDADGVVRQARVGYPAREGRDQGTWAASSARRLTGRDVLPTALPLSGTFWIDPSVAWKEGDRVAWRNVARELLRQPSLFSGALVLVGADFAGSGDEVHRVASGLDVPGVVLQAMTVDTIIRGFPIREARWAGGLVGLGAWVVLAAFGFVMLTARRPIRVALAGAVLAAFYMAGALAVFPHTRVLLPIVAPVIQMIGSMLSGFLLNRALSPFPTA